MRVFHRSGGKVSVSLASGETLTGDSVVVTVPLGVLQANTITFEPALPAQFHKVGRRKPGDRFTITRE
jgi:monoamine oxidase